MSVFKAMCTRHLSLLSGSSSSARWSTIDQRQTAPNGSRGKSGVETCQAIRERREDGWNFDFLDDPDPCNLFNYLQPD
jgi:hypothetical protein